MPEVEQSSLPVSAIHNDLVSETYIINFMVAMTIVKIKVISDSVALHITKRQTLHTTYPHGNS